MHKRVAEETYWAGMETENDLREGSEARETSNETK